MPVILRPKTKVSIDSIGEVSLYSLTLGLTEHFFITVARSEITDKEFVQDILFHLLFSPKMSREEFEAIADDDLIKIAKAFIEAEAYTFKEYTDTGNIYLDFRKTITELVKEEERKLHIQFARITEQMTETLKGTALSNLGFNALTSSIIPQPINELKNMVALAAKVDFKLLQVAIGDNKKALEMFNSYWKDYLALNDKITANVFATFAAQNLHSQQNLAKELQEALQLSIKNERTFVSHIQEINSYPKEQKSILHKKAGIKFFSIEEFEEILLKIKQSVEIHSQLMFWDARTENIISGNLERIAQGHMMGLLYMGLPTKVALGFQQLRSGSGIIDILIIFSNEHGEQQKIILELKVFDEGHSLNDGIKQLGKYMENEETEHGYRVIFNATLGELEMQQSLATNGKTVKNFVININLPNPSLLDKKNKSLPLPRSQ